MLAAYADHPNVAGLTVFSLGCEKAQIGLFQEALRERNLGFDKPCILLRQQDWSSEVKMMEEAVRQNAGDRRTPIWWSAAPCRSRKLKLGVKLRRLGRLFRHFGQSTVIVILIAW